MAVRSVMIRHNCWLIHVKRVFNKTAVHQKTDIRKLYCCRSHAHWRCINDQHRRRTTYMLISHRSLAQDVDERVPKLSEETFVSEKPEPKIDENEEEQIVIDYYRGLPRITVPLPSRKEKCRFTLKPISNCVRDLTTMIREEDRGIDRVVLHTKDNVRISSSCSIEVLLEEEEFYLTINDRTYRIRTPPEAKKSFTKDDVEKLADVRILIAQLYESLNLKEFHVHKEQELLSKLERIQSSLDPLEEKRQLLEKRVGFRTSVLTWVGLSMMSVQFGILARLTWWEYSWDIMEPVTYFVTYGTAMATYSKTVVIKTKQGALKGLELKSRGGTKYHAFLGIPYAKPPTGELRFEPPQPSDSWAGERDATTQPPVCTQRASFATNESKVYVIGQEDCLYLNVYTPSNVSGELLPTLIYIHGGALIAGSAGFHDPHYFMDHATVLVILQYRLNLFGFLSAADEILPGNYGLKDQVAALKWVQQNIAYFGGNPERVTIFGHSAGACSVHYHMHSPLSKGLFHQAISQSGTALASWAQIPSSVARQKFLSVGLLAGCPTQSTKVLVKCLKKVPAEKLVQIHSKFFVWDVEPSVTFSVVVEPKSVVGAFLIENPWKQNVLHDVPWIVGFTSGEGAIKAARYLSDGGKLADELNASFKRLFPLLFYYQYQYWLKPDHYDIISEALKQYYFGEKKIGFETAHNLVDMITDGFFAFDSIEAANRHTNKLYVYYYDHRNERSFSEVNGNCPIELGVTHADDLLSIFHVPMLFPKLSSDSDINVSKRILKYWVNFGHTGNPSKDNSWFPSKSEELDYLHITTTEDRMEKGLLQDRYKFWKKLFIDHPSNIVTNETNEKDEL